MQFLVLSHLLPAPPPVYGEYGPDRGEAVDVVGPVQGIEADDEAALLLGLHLHHRVHLLGDQQAGGERVAEVVDEQAVRDNVQLLLLLALEKA